MACSLDIMRGFVFESMQLWRSAAFRPAQRGKKRAGGGAIQINFGISRPTLMMGLRRCVTWGRLVGSAAPWKVSLACAAPWGTKLMSQELRS